MNSLIKILIVFWIAQTVCCKINRDFYKSRYSIFSNVFDGLKSSTIVENCHKYEMIHILYKPTEEIMNNSEKIINSTEEMYDDLSQQLNCSETTLNSKIMDSKSELKSFFSNCIDSKYIEVVDKLHEMDSKLMKLRCKMSDEDAKELHEIVANSDENRCVNENIFQFFSCFFSEPEIMQN